MLLNVLLQSSSRYKGQLFTPSDPRQNFIFLLIMFATMLLLIVGNKLSNHGNEGSKKYSKRAFRREATRIGLTKKQSRLLESFIKTYHVTKPFALLSNTRTLNNTLGQALRDINHMEAPPAVVEERKLNVYRIKQRIERVFAESTELSDTKKLKLSQQLTFKMPNGNRYSSVVTANLKEFYCARVPLNKNGTEIRWNKGSKVDILIWGKDGEEYTFSTKVMGYNSVKGITSVFLQHSNKISRSYQRKFKRKPSSVPVTFFLSRSELPVPEKKREKRGYRTEKQGRMGTITNLSAGGCSIQTTNPMQKGELIKLNFEPTKGILLQPMEKLWISEARPGYTQPYILCSHGLPVRT